MPVLPPVKSLNVIWILELHCNRSYKHRCFMSYATSRGKRIKKIFVWLAELPSTVLLTA